MKTARWNDSLLDVGLNHLYLRTLVVWIMIAASLNSEKLCLPVMGWRIRSCESVWVQVLLSYPGRGTGWCWNQIPHCRWGRCTGSCHRNSHTGPPHTAPCSSHTRSRLRQTGEDGVRARMQQQGHRRDTQSSLYPLKNHTSRPINCIYSRRCQQNYFIIKLWFQKIFAPVKETYMTKKLLNKSFFLYIQQWFLFCPLQLFYFFFRSPGESYKPTHLLVSPGGLV